MSSATPFDFKKFKNSIVKDKNTHISQAIVELTSDKRRAAIKPMTVKDQKEFLKAMEKQDQYLINQSFDAIIERCVDNIEGQPFDGDYLTLQDRTYLLLKIRQQTTGDKTKITHIHSKTGEPVQDVEIDLKQALQVKYFEGDSLTKEMKLSDNVKILLGPVLRKDEKELDTWCRKTENKDSIVNRKYASYATLIKKVFYINPETKELEEVTDLTFDNKVDIVTDCFDLKQTQEVEDFVKTLDFGATVKFRFDDKNGYVNDEEEVNFISFFIR